MRDSERKEAAEWLCRERAIVPQPATGSAGILEQVASLLRSGRSEPRDEPFRGFDSPPGKF